MVSTMYLLFPIVNLFKMYEVTQDLGGYDQVGLVVPTSELHSWSENSSPKK
jgi:hypothetical protein